MKIAICGSDDESRSNLIKSFISQWPMYATPAETIFDEVKWPENCEKDLDELKEKLNPIEQMLFAKMILIEKQYDTYKDVGHIIYNGCGMDILVISLILCEEGHVSEDFVERVIYHNKKLLRKIDVVYYQPNINLSKESSEEDKHLENVYWNLYDNYQTDFDNSPFFDQKNCPSILLLETKSPINEIKMLLDKDGNLEGTSHGGDDSPLMDVARLKKVLRNNPKLLDAALESIKNDKPYNVGSIIL